MNKYLCGLSAFVCLLSSPALAVSCLDNGWPVVKARGGDITPTRGQVLDMRGVTIETNKAVRAPDAVFLRNPDNVCVLGPRIIGMQPRDMTWANVKGASPDRKGPGGTGNYDTDGVHGNHSIGAVIIEDAYIENVEDALGPPKGPDSPRTSSMLARRVHAVYIRDDFFENDDCLKGEIDDSLIDGAHMLVSQTHGENGGPCGADGDAFVIRDTVAALTCKPDRRARRDGQAIPGGVEAGAVSATSCPPGTGIGQLFKGGGRFDISNSVFMVEAVSNNGPQGMGFPSGTYQNVTLVWLGSGNYPGSLPASGVTVTKDRSVYDKAKAGWIAAHEALPTPPIVLPPIVVPTSACVFGLDGMTVTVTPRPCTVP